MIRPPPNSTLFPSTPLSRSLAERETSHEHEPVRRRNEGRQVVQAVRVHAPEDRARQLRDRRGADGLDPLGRVRSEEHTSELQSPCNLVCRLLLLKKKKKRNV